MIRFGFHLSLKIDIKQLILPEVFFMNGELLSFLLHGKMKNWLEQFALLSISKQIRIMKSGNAFLAFLN